MNEQITKILNEHIETVENLRLVAPKIQDVANQFVKCFRRNGKLIYMGNGGSAVDAMHLSGEFVSIFVKSRQRKSLPAIALSANQAIITSIANDWNYEYIFARQLESLASENDLVIGLSTSGESKNIIKAFEYCKKHHITTASFTGQKENSLEKSANFHLAMPSDITARIQEAYMLVNHIICELVDQAMTK